MATKQPNLKVVQTSERQATIPGHLGPFGRDLWLSIQGAYEITDPGGLALLQTACEAADRVASVRGQIDQDGELLMVRGLPRVNPLCAVERDQRAAMVRAIRALNLDIEPIKSIGRPPSSSGWHG